MARFALPVATVALVLAQLVFTSAQSRSEVLERSFQAGGTVILELSAGGYEIVGTPDNRIRVDWRKSDSRGVNVDVEVKGSQAEIQIDGPMTKGAEARIELPQRTNLIVRLSAGELRITGIEGSKDVSARAGEIDIEVGRREQYRRVDASVNIGELSAGVFNIKKEGFFRSFTWAGKGQYDLRARLTVGELNLDR
jgi:hypothetical protein